MLTAVTEVDNHVVYFDKYFTSYQLMSELSGKKIRVCGSVRENRTSHCPLKPKKILKKKFVLLSTIELMVMLYM